MTASDGLPQNPPVPLPAEQGRMRNDARLQVQTGADTSGPGRPKAGLINLVDEGSGGGLRTVLRNITRQEALALFHQLGDYLIATTNRSADRG